jgi:hypothetical protein
MEYEDEATCANCKNWSLMHGGGNTIRGGKIPYRGIMPGTIPPHPTCPIASFAIGTGSIKMWLLVPTLKSEF